MGKRVLIVGRFDRRARIAHSTVTDGKTITHQSHVGGIKSGYTIPVPKEDA
jgi:hypothetical protein